MKVGLGLYRHMLTDRNFAFAKQCGVTHIVAHLVDYFASVPRLPGQGSAGWGRAGTDPADWSAERLVALRSRINSFGLELGAIENFDPAHWSDVLTGGPQRDQQLEFLKSVIRGLGEAGIPVIGYNFSIAGVWGWRNGPFARGGAESVGLVEADAPFDSPIPNGTIWNMVVDPDAPPGFLEPVGREKLWDNVRYFLDALLPVAEEAGVTLAAHPDDPPMATMRGHARFVHQPRYYDQLFGERPSRANRAELCIGSLQEMSETSDIYADVERWSSQNRVGFVHLRNVRGKVPNYHEVFIDEGDVDIPRVLEILHRNGFEGVITPDHTPNLSCDAPWHAGMAFALGYIRAVISQLDRAAV